MDNRKILNSKKKTFKFTHPYENNSDEYCKIDITLKEIQYKYKNTNKIIYHITYNNIFSEGESLRCHPLYINYKSHLDGDIIIKNELTEVLTKYLFMDDEELSNHTGHSTAMSYRGAIMRNIANLWD